MATSSKTKKGGYKTTKHHREVVKEYDKKNTTSIRLKLNKKTDKDLLEKLERSGNKQGTIKKALRSAKLNGTGTTGTTATTGTTSKRKKASKK